MIGRELRGLIEFKREDQQEEELLGWTQDNRDSTGRKNSGGNARVSSMIRIGNSSKDSSPTQVRKSQNQLIEIDKMLSPWDDEGHTEGMNTHGIKMGNNQNPFSSTKRNSYFDNVLIQFMNEDETRTKSQQIKKFKKKKKDEKNEGIVKTVRNSIDFGKEDDPHLSEKVSQLISKNTPETDAPNQSTGSSTTKFLASATSNQRLLLRSQLSFRPMFQYNKNQYQQSEITDDKRQELGEENNFVHQGIFKSSLLQLKTQENEEGDENDEEINIQKDFEELTNQVKATSKERFARQSEDSSKNHPPTQSPSRVQKHRSLKQLFPPQYTMIGDNKMWNSTTNEYNNYLCVKTEPGGATTTKNNNVVPNNQLYYPDKNQRKTRSKIVEQQSQQQISQQLNFAIQSAQITQINKFFRSRKGSKEKLTHSLPKYSSEKQLQGTPFFSKKRSNLSYRDRKEQFQMICNSKLHDSGLFSGQSMYGSFTTPQQIQEQDTINLSQKDFPKQDRYATRKEDRLSRYEKPISYILKPKSMPLSQNTINFQKVQESEYIRTSDSNLKSRSKANFLAQSNLDKKEDELTRLRESIKVENDNNNNNQKEEQQQQQIQTITDNLQEEFVSLHHIATDGNNYNTNFISLNDQYLIKKKEETLLEKQYPFILLSSNKTPLKRNTTASQSPIKKSYNDDPDLVHNIFLKGKAQNEPNLNLVINSIKNEKQKIPLNSVLQKHQQVVKQKKERIHKEFKEEVLKVLKSMNQQ